jgi:RNA polymerase sigma factor (sigma-70 family)
MILAWVRSVRFGVTRLARRSGDQVQARQDRILRGGGPFVASASSGHPRKPAISRTRGHYHATYTSPGEDARLPNCAAIMAAGVLTAGGSTGREPLVASPTPRPSGSSAGAELPLVATGLQERTRMTRGEEFEELRPLLFAIAYRILGGVAEAEDAVQETWLRYESSLAQPTSTKAFLSAVVTRVSIDVPRSARVRRESYVGPWFPEPLLTDPYEDPARSAELADSLSMAALLLLERLSPLERAVFVLRDVFGFGFPEIASAVGRSEEACRQLAVRARRHMDDGRPRFEADRREREELARAFSTRSAMATSTD